MKNFLIVLIGLMALFASCVDVVSETDTERDKRILREEGYEFIEWMDPNIEGNPYTCPQNKEHTAGWKAVNPDGVVVTGVICWNESSRETYFINIIDDGQSELTDPLKEHRLIIKGDTSYIELR